MVATRGGERGPEAALVDLAVTDDGELVFDSRSEARKIAHLRADPRVALVVGFGDESLQIEGLAGVVTGPARLTFGHLYEARFPGSRALDDEFAVVVVTPRWLRYYDAGSVPAGTVESELGGPGHEPDHTA